MGLKRLLRMERRADVGDAVLQAFQDSLLGGPAGHVDPTATASVETSIRALSSPYGLATVTGPAMITPAFLADLARRLFTSGNAVYEIVINEGISLVPASDFEVAGSVGRWVYELETPIPGQSRVARRRVAEDGVVHVRINPSPSEPWRGRAPWQTRQCHQPKRYAQIERSAWEWMRHRQDRHDPMPQPDGASLNAIAQMKAALTRAGRVVSTLVETTAHGFGQGVTPRRRNRIGRKSGFGAMVPEHNIEHRPPGSIRQRPSWTAFGVSPAMFRGDGNAHARIPQGDVP